ncbi:hypothetical protein H2199_008730 [Coniosporium tulheliwenetii]|uniref:Uncharacterized protein n=1 Tax=Coniosporium tulheliwenetii TaxID=3383036 RepID=A0ACC2YIW9_9PEZI|nr:hypothetical protein H2199_008730 [Cladosporium sp. JES 115]
MDRITFVDETSTLHNLYNEEGLDDSIYGPEQIINSALDRPAKHARNASNDTDVSGTMPGPGLHRANGQDAVASRDGDSVQRYIESTRSEPLDGALPACALGSNPSAGLNERVLRLNYPIDLYANPSASGSTEGMDTPGFMSNSDIAMVDSPLPAPSGDFSCNLDNLATLALSMQPQSIDSPASPTIGALKELPSYTSAARARTGTRAFPLDDVEEGKLMRHYINNLGSWFDTCDPERTFTIQVPVLAANCPTLLNAIFALSSRHLAGTSNYDPSISGKYHERCLEHMIPVLNDPDAVMDDVLLAAACLLRTLEELDVSLTGTDNERHLLGTQVFVNTPRTPGVISSLREAALQCAIRQEIWMAVVHQRPMKISSEHSRIDRTLSPTDDHGVWACRMVLFCTDVVQSCFGETELSVARYFELLSYDVRWLASRPVSWQPFIHKPADHSRGEVFPQLWLMNDAMVLGTLHHHLARLLLACFNPTIPRVGLGHKSARKAADEEIRSHVFDICGLALSNRQTATAMFTASIAIAMCGDRFTDRLEQEGLLSVLEITEKNHAWPTRGAEAMLRSGWGWV